MNPKFLVSLLLIFQVLNVSGQFSWSNPQPSGYSNTKVLFANDSTGYIMNNNGNLITTVNSGLTWKAQQNFPNCNTMDGFDSVFVVGGSDTVIYLSTDKAKSWRARSIKNNDIINKIQIVSKDTIFIVSKSFNVGTTELFQSVDRGNTWNLINSSFIIKSIDFINSKLGFATSFGGTFKTIDGGKTWQNISAQGGSYSFVKFRDQNIGFVYIGSGLFLKTADGGVTWSVSISNLAGIIYSICFANATTVFIAGESGHIYRSTDNGITWEYKGPNNTGYDYDIYSMCFTNANAGFAAGIRGQILKTTDLGDTYHDYSPTYFDIKPISFPSSSVGYAASWTEILKTTDSGKTWIKLPFSLKGTPYRFQQIHFFSNDTGIALAESPVQLYKTYDGGKSWKSLTLPVLYKDNIRGFFFIRNTGYLNIEGAYGNTMLQTKDRGETWQIQSTQYQGAYQNLHFVDEKVGYRNVGATLYKTLDSAKTWQAIMNNTNLINGIWFSDPATGYVVGGDGYNQKSTDSGHTWNRFNIIPDNANFNQVYAIRFFNKKVGYLVSGGGGIYRTIDEGKNWKAEKPTPLDCKTIEMTPDTSVYIAGSYGAILKKDMREYLIDSLKVALESSCSARVSASVTAVLSTVDSVWFEYGTTGFTKKILATPSKVTDTTVKTEALLVNLSADSMYMVRLKIYYRGNYYYYRTSNSFKPANLPKPTITSLGDSVLVSSVSSNYQWYLNNNKLTSDTSKSIQIKKIGFYRVETSPNKTCWDASNDYPLLVLRNRLSDTLKVQIYPNPASGMFNVVITLPAVSGVVVSVSIVNTLGNVVLQTEKLFFYSNQIKVPITLNATGVYNVKVTINGEVKTQTVIMQ